MKKVVRLTESDLIKVVQKVINEQQITQKPTDHISLYRLLKSNGVEEQPARLMGDIFEAILNKKVSVKQGIYDFNKKYPNVTIPASLILTLL